MQESSVAILLSQLLSRKQIFFFDDSRKLYDLEILRVIDMVLKW